MYLQINEATFYFKNQNLLYINHIGGFRLYSRALPGRWVLPFPKCISTTMLWLPFWHSAYCDINNFVHIWRKFIIYVCRTGGCWRFPTFQIMCSLHRTWQSWSASNLCWSCCSRYEAWDEVSVVSPSKLRVQRAKFFYLYLYRMILCLLYYLRKSNCRRLIISFSALSTWIWASVHNGCLKISLYWLHIFCLFLYNMKQVSNTFYFTFTVRPEAKATKNGFRLRNVVPATEEEARRVLERMDAEALQRSQSI